MRTRWVFVLLMLVLAARAEAQLLITAEPNTNEGILNTVTGTINAGGITSPTCTTNCGTSPTVVGGDSAMHVTLGAGAASAFLITFYTPYATEPVCSGTMARVGMANSRTPTTMVTTTTTVTVVTNGAAPADGDMYNIICIGVK